MSCSGASHQQKWPTSYSLHYNFLFCFVLFEFWLMPIRVELNRIKIEIDRFECNCCYIVSHMWLGIILVACNHIWIDNKRVSSENFMKEADWATYNARIKGQKRRLKVKLYLWSLATKKNYCHKMIEFTSHRMLIVCSLATPTPTPKTTTTTNWADSQIWCS